MTPPFNPSAPATVESAMWSVLAEILDPELDCNLVDLGLIYGVELEHGIATVRMTLTTPGCPMQQSIVSGVEFALLSIDGVDGVRIELVWDPPWHAGLMSEAGRRRTGC